MRTCAAFILAIMLASAQVQGAEKMWYAGDEHCPPPRDDGTYSAPYNALDHRLEPPAPPAVPDADTPGWSCSYQRDDGVVVQFGDSRTPRQQWLAVWGDNSNN